MELVHNKKVTELLTNMSKTQEFPNLLFYGISGSGKHTRIIYFLSKFFNADTTPINVENREFKVNSKSFTVEIKRSMFHSEIEPSNYGVHDKNIVQDIIKELAESPSVIHFTKKCVKVLVINKADNLTKQAQQALRRTMEKYSKICRIILSCENLSKIISPLRSRCLNIRIAAPTKKEMKEIIGTDEVNTFNIRKALLMKKANIDSLEWEKNIKKITNETNILKIRDEITNLLNAGIPDYILFRYLTNEYITIYSNKRDIIIQNAAEYQHRSIMGQKSLYHLEAFVLSVIS